MVKKSKKHNKRNKTLKKDGNLCTNFCKNKYSPEIVKQFNKIAKKKNYPLLTTTKKDMSQRIAFCKQNFCNEGCKGYDFSKEEEAKFKKNINGNFTKSVKPKLIQKLKSVGAISYCDYNGYNPL